jgi:hypothetical protein
MTSFLALGLDLGFSGSTGVGAGAGAVAGAGVGVGAGAGAGTFSFRTRAFFTGAGAGSDILLIQYGFGRSNLQTLHSLYPLWIFNFFRGAGMRLNQEILFYGLSVARLP